MLMRIFLKFMILVSKLIWVIGVRWKIVELCLLVFVVYEFVCCLFVIMV